MAQSGYTPIQLYYSSTTTNVPLAANLASGELAINITDGKLFYKDNANAVQVIGWKVVPATAGGTGQTSYAVGDLLYADTTTSLAKLPDVATGNALISGGVSTAPSWGKIGLTTHVSGTLPTANGGTNLTSFTANGVVYASSTSALATGTGLTFNGSDLFVANGATQVSAGSGTGYSAKLSCAYNFPTVDTYLDSIGGASYSGQIIFRTSSNAGSITERVRIDGNGNLIVGDTSSSTRLRIKGANSTDDLLRAVTNGGTSAFYTCASNASLSTGESGTASVWYVRKDGTTSRSINAAGTINASGADYAEYMTKSGDFAVAKGDVVGIDAQGKLTNVFVDAVSFAVKSTNPSYVGGDVWGSTEALGLAHPEKPIRIPDEVELRLVSEATETEEAVHEIIVKKAGDSDQEWAAKEAAYATAKTAFDAALEAARQMVDRIAFAGQVPVNVMGATAGEYIVPVNDNGAIKGSSVSNPTFEQYQSAVGKVIAIEQDGRARIIVKVV